METPYGYCPICKAPGVARERRPNGNDRCANGHIYIRSTALKTLPTEKEQPVQRMTFDEYQKLAERTECNQTIALVNMSHGVIDPKVDGDGTGHLHTADLRTIRLNHAIIGLAGETGELASLFQKWVYYNKKYSPDELKTKLLEEFGDVLWHVAEGLNALGISMQDVAERNIAKLKIRYPERYTDQNADNRNLKEEEMALRVHQPQPMDYEQPVDDDFGKTL